MAWPRPPFPGPLPAAALALVAGLLLGRFPWSACTLPLLLLVDVRLPGARVPARALLLGVVLARTEVAPRPEVEASLPAGGVVTCVEGVVRRVEPPPGGGQRFLLDAGTAGEGAAARPWRARVDVDVGGALRAVLLPGDRVRVVLRLRPVSGPRTPGGPDPRRWARVHGVDAWGRAEDARDVDVVERATGPAAAVAGWRRQASAALGRAFDAEDGGLARALLLGDRGGLTAGDRERFRAAGQAHLVAVSGQHVALVLAAVLVLARRLGAGARGAALLGLAAVAVYVPLTGSPPSGVRSGLGASLWLVGRLCLREPAGVPLLAAAALVMLAWAPNDLHDPGFTLSFGAVLGIELLGPRFTAALVPSAPVLPGLLPHRPARIRRLLAVALAAWLGSAGLALFLLGQVNLAAAPLSVPAVPLAAALLALSALVVVASPVPFLAAAPAWLFGRTADLLRALLEVPPHVGLATVTVPPPGAGWLALSVGTLALAGLGPPRLLRWALLAQALLFAAALAPPFPSAPPSDTARPAAEVGPYHPARVPPLADETLLLFAAGLAAFALVTVVPLRWLRPGGAVAAWALGVLVAYAFGWSGFATLFAPFVVATLLGKLPGAARDRGRTAKQVLSNGLPAALGALVSLLPGWEHVGVHFFLGSLACLGADTCATEVGVRYGGPPRSVLSGRTLPPGESGGITSAGLVASLLGALLAPAAWVLVVGAPEVPGEVVAALLGLYGCAGFGAALLDSVLGATLQFRGRAPAGNVVEARRADGQPTEHVSGWRWLDNDAVNLVAGVAGGLLAVALLSLWF